MYKRDVINFLFVSAFPVFGVGTYISAAVSPTVGYITCSLPYVLMILFHLVDLVYKKEFSIRLNANYYLMLLFIISSIASLVVAYGKALPEFPLHIMLLKALFLFVPFHAFLIVSVYNDDGSRIVRLTFTGLSILLVLNVVGYYGLGLSNLLHYIEGRLNFPFLDGIYGVAGLVAVINLMLYFYLKQSVQKPLTSFFLTTYLLINLVLFFYINSRLCILVFVFVVALLVLNVLKKFSWVFLISLFTIPIILSASLLIYEILSLPFFKTILQRVDYADIVTFHGRSYLWQTVFDWLQNDREGLLFGNGFQGHYFLDLLGGLGRMFDIKALYYVHLHSVPLEILVSQGLLTLVLFFVILYRTFSYFRRQYQINSAEGAFFPVVLFFLFIIHIDANGYMNNSAGLILALLISRISVMASAAIEKTEEPVYFSEGLKTTY